MRRVLLGLCLVAALAVLAKLWSSARRASDTPVPAPSLGTAQGTTGVPNEVGASIPDTTATTRTQVAAHLTREPDVIDDPRDDLVVRVVDPSGRPVAGIPAKLEPDIVEGLAIPGETFSDADGRISIHGVRGLLAKAVPPWRLRHDLPFDRPPGLVLDASVLAEPVAVSPLPWGGLIDVTVRELDGRVAPDGSYVGLMLVRPEDESNLFASGTTWGVVTKSGEVSYPWVELGRTWELVARRPGANVTSRVRLLGPVGLRERVQAKIVLGSDYPVVSFRAVDADGDPIALTTLQLSRADRFRRTTKLQASTDASGRFSVDVEQPESGDGRFFVVTYRHLNGSTLQAKAELPALRAGWNDGGDVVLDAPPCLCSGLVKDESGRPVSGAGLLAASRLSEHGTGFLRGVEQIHGVTDAEGRFALRGYLEVENFEVRAQTHSARSNTLRTRTGARDLELVLVTRYIVSGELLVPESIDSHALRCELRSYADPSTRFSATAESADSLTARFTLQHVPHGTYDLLLSLGQFELSRLPELVVQGNVDVGRIDLRGRMYACDIEMLGAVEGSSLAGQLVWSPTGTDDQITAKIDGEHIRILTPLVPIDVTLRPVGFRSVTLHIGEGLHQAVLEPPLRAKIVLVTNIDLPAPPYFLRCDLRQGTTPIGSPDGMPYFTHDNREVKLLVSNPGTAKVHWHLVRRMSDNGSTSADVLHGHEIEVEILDVGEEQVFAVELDGDALDTLITDPPR